MYGEPLPLHGSPHLPLSAEPSEIYMGQMHPHASPHQPYRDFVDDGAVKLEEPSQVIVPSQAPGAFYHPSSQAGMHHAMSVPAPLSYLSPHTGLPVQHTDDAASKETQYLRRRCFNCHTTEPPSWRRSTLNPGKIVCNKCGLYERTHLRPRPLRFDELRAGNKARKGSKGAAAAAAAAQQNGAPSPPSPKRTVVKKEPREYGIGPAQEGAMAISRRSSISSASSASGTSDWDDSGTSRSLVSV
jgi:GATA-binding protein, other eukaryote